MIKKEILPATNKTLVTFEYAAAVRAKTVHLVGDFNGWSETDTPMTLDKRRGLWTHQIEMERGRDYQFRYLVDGATWHNDWHADDYVPNVYDSDNSVVSG